MALNDAISYWAFDESGSGDAADSSGNSKTLTNTNTIPYVAGKIANAADFEFASAQYFTRSNGTYYNITSGTINCWIKPETIDVTPGNVALFSTATNIGVGGFHFQLRPHNSDTLSFYFGAGNGNAEGATTLVSGTWYMVTATWDTTGKEVFVNALSDGSSGLDETMTAGSANLYVGRYSQTDAQWYDGLMDEVGIWNRILSGPEITELYNSGTGKNPYAVATNANFLAFM